MKRVAIVGSGSGGLAAAYALREHCHLTLFERERHFGGHAYSVPIPGEEEGRVDVAFMVYNRRNYPRFCALLDALGVAGEATEMSFSVVHEDYAIEYNGGSWRGLMADRRNLLRPGFWSLLSEILRFNRLAKNGLAAGIDELETLESFIRRHSLAYLFANAYLFPMGAAIWSCHPDSLSRASARFVLSFFDNHGLLDLRNRPQWMFIRGGSRHYVRRLLAAIPRLECRQEAALAVSPEGTVTTAAGGERFDAVVIATHAPDAFALLSVPTPVQQLLSTFRYTKTRAFLHEDDRVLPRRAPARASWNYRLRTVDGRLLAFPTYDLSRLQGLRRRTPLLLTLNAEQAGLAAERVHEAYDFSHPLPDIDALRARKRFDEINEAGTLYFCGAYWGNGFHEDGVVSGEAVADKIMRNGG